MDSLVLHIFFQGLIAFMPNNDLAKGANTMTAFLLSDAHHAPVLSFKIDASRTNMSSSCPAGNDLVACQKMSGLQREQFCACKLTAGVTVSFMPDTVHANRALTLVQGAKPTPSNLSDFSWLVRMSDMAGKKVGLNKGLLGDAVSVSFGWFAETACHLDQVDDGSAGAPAYDVSQFEFFDKMGVSGSAHALAEDVRFESHIFPGPTAEMIIISKGGRQYTIDLGCDAQNCPAVLLANLPTADCANDPNVGCHFDAYYSVAQDTGLRHLLPRRIGPRALSLGATQIFSCPEDPFLIEGPIDPNSLGPQAQDRRFIDSAIKLSLSNAGSRVICPMALFDPQ
jgi:hypothetical protein